MLCENRYRKILASYPRRHADCSILHPSVKTMSETSGTPVTITNIDIPFGRLILIILKWMFASIPALIIFYVIIGGIALVLALILGAVTGGGHSILEQLKHMSPPQQ